MIQLRDRVYRFQSKTGVDQSHLIEISVDLYGVTTVQSVRSEQAATIRGLDGCECLSDFSAELASDISEAVQAAKVLSQTHIAWSSQVSFTGQTQISVQIPIRLSSALYLVGAVASNGAVVVATDLKANSFVLQTVPALGSVAQPVSVDVVVAVPLILAPPFFGELVFRSGDPQTQRISLRPNSIPPSGYRVLVVPDGAFAVAATRSIDYFEITIGASVPHGAEKRVRYGVVFR